LGAIIRKCSNNLPEQSTSAAEPLEPKNTAVVETAKPKQETRATFKHEQVENNLSESVIRIEATVVRVMKRATIVADLKTLHALTVAALAHTTWASTLSPRRRGQLVTNAFSLADLKKIVKSLIKQGYLRCMTSGEIVYEP